MRTVLTMVVMVAATLVVAATGLDAGQRPASTLWETKTSDVSRVAESHAWLRIGGAVLLPVAPGTFH